MTGWTEPAAVPDALRRRWDRGDLLRAHVGLLPWDAVSVSISGPKAGEVASQFDQVRAWAGRWATAARTKPIRIETRTVGGRLVGVNEVPARAWIDRLEDAWPILGVRSQVQRLDGLIDDTADIRVAEWIRRHPMRTLAAAEDWPRLLATVDWIEAHQTSGVYLRQIDAPGVDTKFIERHQRLLAQLLAEVLPPDRIDTAVPIGRFAQRHGFANKPEYIRLRHLDPRGHEFTEMTVRADELARQPPRAVRAIVAENEISYLALPPLAETVAVFGSGLHLERFTTQTWLNDVALAYWGDVDTHGLAILSDFRRRFGHTESLLMDRRTLLDHRDHWVVEPKQRRAILTHLKPAEADVYADLVDGVFGDKIRLEQERIRFSRVEAALQLWAATS